MEAIIRPYRAGEERYVADAHRRVYAEEYNWGKAFTDYAADIALSFAAKKPDEGEGLWVAELEGSLVGCIMLCRTDSPYVGQLRLFLVEKSCRGAGIGTALMNTLMKKAKSASYKKLILWTASPLHEAIRQYEKMGFTVQDEAENTDWSLSGETVIEIKMEKPLREQDA